MRGEPNRENVAALFSALYQELHRMARRQLAHRGGPAVTFGTTSLIHETYMAMSDRRAAVFPDQTRFMAYAARVMRGLIIDHLRNRRADKRGGQFQITSLDTDVQAGGADTEDLVCIGDAVDELAKAEPILAEIVDLKFFCGFSFAQIAAMRGVSERTVQRSWEKARSYLQRAIRTTPLGGETDGQA